MSEKVYYGVYDLNGWKTAVTDGEIQKHLSCSYYAGWLNPDGRLHAVNYHTAFNSDNPTNKGQDATYTANYRNGYVRWYGTPKGEMGIETRNGLTDAQADTLDNLLQHLETTITVIDAKRFSGFLHTHTEASAHFHQLARTTQNA